MRDPLFEAIEAILLTNLIPALERLKGRYLGCLLIPSSIALDLTIEVRKFPE